jgi:hypothetical protein
MINEKVGGVKASIFRASQSPKSPCLLNRSLIDVNQRLNFEIFCISGYRNLSFLFIKPYWDFCLTYDAPCERVANSGNPNDFVPRSRTSRQLQVLNVLLFV